MSLYRQSMKQRVSQETAALGSLKIRIRVSLVFSAVDEKNP